jgi:hypothetical protein
VSLDIGQRIRAILLDPRQRVQCFDGQVAAYSLALFFCLRMERIVDVHAVVLGVRHCCGG